MLNYPDVCTLGAASIRRIPFHICKKLTLIYIESGQLQFSTVAGKQTLHEGQLEILNVKEPVMMEAESDDSCRILYFCFDDVLLLHTDMNFEWVTYNCNICNFFGAAAKKSILIHSPHSSFILHRNYTRVSPLLRLLIKRWKCSIIL